MGMMFFGLPGRILPAAQLGTKPVGPLGRKCYSGATGWHMDAVEQSLRVIHFSDTTLRDGEQMPGAALSGEQKVVIARALQQAGVSSIDAGFPACAASEIAAIREVAAAVPQINVSALCRTLRSDIDLAWEALGDAQPDKRSVSLFVGTSPAHRAHKLRQTVPQLIELARNAIGYARERFAGVAFSPEDASRTEIHVLCEIYREAIDAGAGVIGFPDTVGVLRPSQVRDFIRRIQDGVSNIGRAMIAVHFHNDLGLATANTLAAIEQGVGIVQGTVNGIGERAGNASLEEFAMLIALHGADLGVRSPIDLSRLTSLSRLVAELTGIDVAVNKAVVGSNIFSTSAGIHQDGLMKDPDTYLPFQPEVVGGPGIRLVLGKHSGKAAIARRLEELGFGLGDEQLAQVIQIVKAAPKEAWNDDAAVLREAVEAISPLCAGAGKRV
jgi:2-isopropylmalate synthase